MVEKTGYVYKYVDNNDGIVKYVGLVNPGNSLKNRINQHKKDKWYHSQFSVYYLEVNTKTDCEFLESFFIAYYGTDKYYNMAKSGWGGSEYISPDAFIWIPYVGNVSSRKEDNAYEYNFNVLNNLYCYLNNKYFNGRINGIPKFINKNKIIPSVDVNKHRVEGDKIYYDIEIPEQLVDNTFDVCKYLVSSMIQVTSEAEKNTTSNRGIYKNSEFKNICADKGFTVTRHEKYGYEISDIPNDLKVIISQYHFRPFNKYGKNDRLPKKPSSTRKYICNTTGESFRATKDLDIIDCGRFIEELEKHYVGNVISISRNELSELINKYHFNKVRSDL